MPKGGVERIQERGQNARRTLAVLERTGDLDAALAVLERALEQAELHAVPEDEEAFTRFVRGPLLEAADAILGPRVFAVTDALLGLVPEPPDPSSGLYEVASPAARPTDEPSSAPVTVSLPRPLCVVVDADEVMRSRAARRLEQDGFIVIQCEDPLAALEACVEHEPALLIAPRDLAGLEGLALARLLHGRMRDAGPAVILYGSGTLSAEDARLVRLVPNDLGLTAMVGEAKRLTGR